jgi:hypothetical protein
MAHGNQTDDMADNIPTDRNNPGDLKDPSTGEIRNFPTPEDGKAALYNDLTAKMTNKSGTGLNGQSSLSDFAKTWAPASDNNDPIQYTANLANQLGVSPDTQIGTLMPRIDDFATAISHNEGYHLPDNQTSSKPQDESFWQQLADPFIGAGKGLADVPIAGLNLLGAGLPYFSPSNAIQAGGMAGPAAIGAILAPEAIPGILSGIGATAKGLLSKIPGLIGSSLEGAAGGYVVDKLLGQGNSDTSAVQNGIQSSLPASTSLMDATSSAIGQTPTGRRSLSDPNTQMGLQGIGTYGYTPDLEEGHMDYTQARAQAKQDLKDLSTATESSLRTEGEAAKMNEAIAEATANMKKYTPSHDWADAEKHIKEQAETYRQNFGREDGSILLADMERGKREQYESAGKWDSTTTSAKRAAHKALGVGLRNVIHKHTNHKPLYEKVMKEEQKIINAQKIMKKLHGKKTPTIKKPVGFFGKLGRTAGRQLGIYLGDKIGGPWGAVVGEMVADHVIRAKDAKRMKTIFETKAMKKAMKTLHGKNPQVAKVLAEQLRKAGIKGYEERILKEIEKADKLKLLPAPKEGGAIPLPAYKGGEPKLYTQEQIKERNKPGGLHGYLKRAEAIKKAVGLVERKPKKPPKVKAKYRKEKI